MDEEENIIGRREAVKKLRENIAKGRSTLLIGDIGVGKTHILRAVAEPIERCIYVERIQPLKSALLETCKALHDKELLHMEGILVEYLNWEDVRKKINRLNVRDLTQLIVNNLKNTGYLVVLDHLESLTPSMVETVQILQENLLVLGATNAIRPSDHLLRVWWKFDRIEVGRLNKEEGRKLLWQVADPDKIEDKRLFETVVLNHANGNPLSIVEMAECAKLEEIATASEIRELRHRAGERYLDLTPFILLLGAFIVATRFVALGLNNRDLYILAGGSGAFFLVFRLYLHRMSKGKDDNV